MFLGLNAFQHVLSITSDHSTLQKVLSFSARQKQPVYSAPRMWDDPCDVPMRTIQPLHCMVPLTGNHTHVAYVTFTSGRRQAGKHSCLLPFKKGRRGRACGKILVHMVMSGKMVKPSKRLAFVSFGLFSSSDKASWCC